MYSDSHVHLEMFPAKELPGVIERAKAAGLVLIVTSGMDTNSSEDAMDIAETYDLVYGNVGIHPWEARAPLGETEMAVLADLAESPKIVGIGEIGLDVNASTSIDSQIDVFRKLVAVARNQGLPVSIHARGIHDDMLEFFRVQRIWEVGGVIHEFTPDENFVRECLEMGFYITAGRSINRLDRPDTVLLQKIIQDVPLDRLVIETDTAPSYGSGTGPQVQPADVLQVARKVAELRGISVEEVGQVTTENLKRAFRIRS